MSGLNMEFLYKWGGDVMANVERGCGVCVTKGCDPNFFRQCTCLQTFTASIHTGEYMYTQCTAHLCTCTEMCKYMCMYELPPPSSHPAHSNVHSMLTRVSCGIKEAPRAKQKCSTCFLKERKHKSRGRVFSQVIQGSQVAMCTERLQKIQGCCYCLNNISAEVRLIASYLECRLEQKSSIESEYSCFTGCTFKICDRYKQ